MKTKRLFIVVFFIFGFITVFNNPNPSQAGIFDSKVEKALKLMRKANELKQIDMLDESLAKLQEAEEILREKIVENTNNLEALYYLGVCLFYQGPNKDNEADGKFMAVYQRDSSYGLKIFNFYIKEGKAYRQAGQPQVAKKYFIRACQYQPNLSNEVAALFFQDGVLELNQRLHREALKSFATASRLNFSFNQKIARTLIDQMDIFKSPRIRMLLLRHAAAFDESYYNEIAKKVIVITRAAKAKQERNRLKKEIALFTKEVRTIVIPIAFPPPTWQTVYGPKEYVNIGYTKGELGDGGIRTVQYNQDMIYGDKVIITGKSFEVWRGQWKKYNERVEIINKNSNGHGFLFARASLGEKITITIKRLME